MFEAEAVVTRFDDVTVMGQSIQQCSHHLGISEYIGPFREAEVSGDVQAGFLKEFADQMKHQGDAC